MTVGSAIDATVSDVDDATGKVVSTQWNSLSEDTRYRLIGTVEIQRQPQPAARAAVRHHKMRALSRAAHFKP
jgi:hypothetical protein